MKETEERTDDGDGFVLVQERGETRKHTRKETDLGPIRDK